ncbi:helix-turn-helix domain-containing protein [Algoriphagus zhangzhouensis]|uniref:Helix-turn-helix domain-containing protein n=1 Tax=Algoriphagus zhangzhouensis TaxID=1073327 RepID=A0A1M7ZEX1_9BACT|nr:helix-turn-helix domain-containing protein [Algoriphagus zhangzhouensis]TDY46147.1 AraC family transcriptional regulator [Algoriphagus zhangzhouensis]SHO63440.1 Helix-turn-helix domain-containing protein [Algoriphagus zhangzhouensis]
MQLILDFLLIGGIIICFLILMLIFKKEKKTRSNIILGLFFILILLVFIHSYSQIHQIKWLFTLTYLPFEALAWIAAPLLCLYIESLFTKQKQFWRKKWFHFTPALLFTCFFSLPILIFWLSGAPKPSYIQNLIGLGETPLVFLESIYLIGYLSYSIRLYNRFKNLLNQSYSNYDIQWIGRLLWGAILITSIDLLTEIYLLLFGEELTFLAGSDAYITLAGILFLVFHLGYYGVNQSKILIPKHLYSPSIPHSEIITEKPSSPVTSPSYSPEDLKGLESDYLQLMQEEKPYLDEDLTLGKMAKLMEVSDKKLSAFLNQYLKISFYDLINQERIKAVCEKIKDPAFSHLTLLGIAFDCGFKSKTSFNRIFKKETGLSPSEYRKKYGEK